MNRTPNRRSSRTRAALIQAGLELFAQRPVDAVSVDEIVASAGVAKGSFFNHFGDKHAFAAAIAGEIRLEIERGIEAANRDVADAAERLAGGMRIAAEYALNERSRSRVLLRANEGTPGADHALNAGVAADMHDAVRQGRARPANGGMGVLFWVGLCRALMYDVARRQLEPGEAAEELRAMLHMGLTGIGLDETSAREIAVRQAAMLRRAGDCN